VPVKSFDWAKSRLEGVLSLSERRELAQRLMRNAVTALVESACFERVIVVSRDDAALAFAAALGAEAMREEGPPDLNEALRGVRSVATAEGASSLLVLFSDLPHVTAADVRALVAASARAPVVIGPDRRAEGTNALLLRPPAAIEYAFGAGSLGKHLAGAAEAGLEVAVLRLDGIGHDVDLPEDLEGIETLSLNVEAS
jgi:2-phospho-L-lactate guanylyltransferase